MEGARLGGKLAVALAALLAVGGVGCSDDEKDPVGNGGSGGSTGTELDLPGLSAPVEASLDETGMFHASCKTDEDCALALGYFHAQNRFFQMDLQRRASRGELGGLISLQLEAAVALRQFFTTPQGEPIEEAIWAILDEETKGHLEAYSAGVNAWLADLRAGRNGARLSEEYGLSLIAPHNTPANIRDWEPLDSVAFARLMTFQLSESSDVELGFAEFVGRMDPAVAADLFTLKPGEESYTVESAGGSFPQALRAPDLAASLRAIQERLAGARDALARARDVRSDLFGVLPTGDAGSNNWVLAPSRTTAGRALLANDPHLSLSNPPVWYFAELDATSAEGATGRMHVAGGTFPGIPYVPIGHNRHVAWGQTVAFYDVTDVYVETLSVDGTKVLFNGAEVPIVTRDYTFPVAGGAPVTRTLKWVPHHGPIVSEDPVNRVAITIKWTGQEPTRELTAFHRLAQATTAAEAKASLDDFGVGAQNTVVIDTAGHIGWYPLANVPKRPWATPTLAPWLPLPGDGTAEWDGYVARDDLPQLTDPPAGFVATANQAMTDAIADGDPTNDGYPVLQDFPAPGFRHRRIVDLLAAGGNAHSPETMLELQSDVYSLPGDRVVPHLLAAAAAAPAELTADGQKVVDALTAWTFGCPTGLDGDRPDSPRSTDPVAARESIGCTAFHHTLLEVYRATFLDEFQADFPGLGLREIPGGHNQLMKVLAILLDRPTELGSAPGLWDDDATAEAEEAKDQILRKALNAAGGKLASQVGQPDSWRWGRFHTVTFRSDLGQLQPLLNDGPWANDGGLFTVDVANPGLDGASFSHGSGASLRLVVEAQDDRMKSWLQLPGGQDLHRDGPYHGTLIERYLHNEPFEVPFTRDEAAAAAVDRLTLVP